MREGGVRIPLGGARRASEGHPPERADSRGQILEGRAEQRKAGQTPEGKVRQGRLGRAE